MIRYIKKRIALKLSLIIATLASIISILFFLYLNNSNMDQLETSLLQTVGRTVEYAELTLSGLIWEYDYKSIERINTGLLNTNEIVAINTYETDNFLIGYMKEKGESDITITSLDKPYTIPDDNGYIKKIFKEMKYNNEIVGNFELFYTDEYIIESGKSANLRSIPLIFILAAAIILFIFLAVNSIVIKPIISLSKTTREIARDKDYSYRISRKGNDEISSLYSSVSEMIGQINEKDKERESLYSELLQSEKNYRFFFEQLKEAVDTGKYEQKKDEDFHDPELLDSLNSILQTLNNSDIFSRKQDWIKTGQTKLNKEISGERKLSELCSNALTFIAKHIGARVGTIYIYDSISKYYKLISSYAYKERKGFNNQFRPGETLAGQAALEKEMIIFSDIPDDYMKIGSSLGNTSPKNLLIFPLVYENECKGVIELGSIESFNEDQIEFCDNVADSTAVAINAAQFNDQLKELLAKTKEQAEELQNQQDELQQANIDLEEKTEKLISSKEQLQIQQKELQASNEEMEEKNEMLESQKEEIQKKNAILKQKQIEVEAKAGQLEQATKYKSEFLANMSHELRTPLNSLLLLAKMLSDNDEKNLSEDQIESASSIYRSGQNLLHLINDILDLSKIEANRVELEISEIKIDSLVSEIGSEFSHVAKEKNLELIIDVDKNSPETIVTDGHRLKQIIRNLVGNSIKFTEEGYIRVAFEPDSSICDRGISISVEDTGSGIPAEKQKLIFESFKQVDGSISRLHGGTGLGLSISRELARLLGGEISLESEYDKGARFVITLPEILIPREIETPPVETEKKRAVSGSRELNPEIVTEPSPEGPEVRTLKTLLIIEDDSEFARTIARISEENGYESIITHDGESGLKYAHEQNPDGIILDIGLPGIDGWAVLNELKTNSITRHIPVHIISGMDSDNKGLHKGAVGFLKKPVSIEDLHSVFGKIEKIVSKNVKELLIIEDDDDLRKTIIKLMSSQDIKTESASTGKKALELIKSKKFDCAILDLGLPDISGFDLLDKIENEAGSEKPPIIVYTGRDLTKEEADKLKEYSSSIVLKNAASFDRLLDETTLFMHQVETDLPNEQQQMLTTLRDKESILLNKSVMIVDDDMRNAFALNKFLKSKGMLTTIADNGKKALDLLKKGKKPDIILMDIMMPQMDGYETIRRIRKMNHMKNLPILALTAKAMDSDRKQCIDAGANDYLTKPVDIPKLLSMLRIWLY